MLNFCYETASFEKYANCLIVSLISCTGRCSIFSGPLVKPAVQGADLQTEILTFDEVY